MKFLLLLSTFVLTTSAWSKTFSHKEFTKLKPHLQVEVVSAYRAFLAHNETLEDETKTTFKLPALIEAAFAADPNYNCFYAGWPSVKVSVSRSKRVCTSPAQGNPRYNRQACGANSLQCQPLLFGAGLCASTATQALKNSAYSQCERKFEQENRSLSQIAQELAQPEKANEAQELFSTVERICSEANPPATCAKLQARVAAIRAQSSSQIAQTETPVVIVDGERERDPAVRDAIIGSVEDANGLQDTVEGSGTVGCVEEHDHSIHQGRDVAQVVVAPDSETTVGDEQDEVAVVDQVTEQPPQVPGGLYTPQQAFADLAAEPLRFVGREYGAGHGSTSEGNLQCIFKNSRVYVIHDGCRPNGTMPLTVFTTRIISRTGGMVDVYVENRQGSYTLNSAGPSHPGDWRVGSRATPPITGELNFAQASAFDRAQRSNYTIPSCTNGTTHSNGMICFAGGVDPGGAINQMFTNPLQNGLTRAHDLIKFAPRR